MTAMTRASRIAAKLRRVMALVRKESRQVMRDPSSIAIGIVMPVDADSAVRLRPVARREERAGRDRARRHLARRRPSWPPASSSRRTFNAQLVTLDGRGRAS